MRRQRIRKKTKRRDKCVAKDDFQRQARCQQGSETTNLPLHQTRRKGTTGRASNSHKEWIPKLCQCDKYTKVSTDYIRWYRSTLSRLVWHWLQRRPNSCSASERSRRLTPQYTCTTHSNNLGRTQSHTKDSIHWTHIRNAIIIAWINARNWWKSILMIMYNADREQLPDGSERCQTCTKSSQPGTKPLRPLSFIQTTGLPRIHNVTTPELGEASSNIDAQVQTPLYVRITSWFWPPSYLNIAMISISRQAKRAGARAKSRGEASSKQNTSGPQDIKKPD